MAKQVGISSQATRYVQFTRNIVPEILEDGTLEIPEEVVWEHGIYFSKRACLKVSTGKTWKVELKRFGTRIWLHKGWQEFVKSCSIECGHSVLFRYEGGYIFHVFIFNASGLEITYPASSVITDQKVKEEDSDDNSSVGNQIIGNISEGDDEVPGFSAKHEVLRRARAFQSPNPHCIVFMRSAYHSHMYIPESPVQRYFHGRDDKNVYLQGPDGRTWSLKFYIRELPPCQVRINLGWKEFAKEYRLNDGDACIFELINSTDLAFNVTMFRIKEVNRKDPIGMRDIPYSAAVNRPSFTIVFKRSIRTSYTMCLPGSHAKTYLLDQHEKEVFLHGLAGKTWPVKGYVYGSNDQYFRFSAGWKEFVIDNDLQEGDAGVFELLSKAPYHYNVTVLRAAESAKLG